MNSTLAYHLQNLNLYSYDELKKYLPEILKKIEDDINEVHMRCGDGFKTKIVTKKVKK